MKTMKCRLRDDNTVLEIIVEINNPISQIFIDTYCNKDKYKSDNSNDHEFSFMIPNNRVITDVSSTHIKYLIPASSLCIKKYNEMYIISAVFGPNVNESQIVYNDQQLLCFRLNLMDNSCIPCSDDKNLSLLQVLMMREVVFRTAVDLDKIDTAVRYYGKILKMKGVSSSGPASNSSCMSCGCNI